MSTTASWTTSHWCRRARAGARLIREHGPTLPARRLGSARLSLRARLRLSRGRRSAANCWRCRERDHPTQSPPAGGHDQHVGGHRLYCAVRRHGRRRARAGRPINRSGGHCALGSRHARRPTRSSIHDTTRYHFMSTTGCFTARAIQPTCQHGSPRKIARSIAAALSGCDAPAGRQPPAGAPACAAAIPHSK